MHLVNRYSDERPAIVVHLWILPRLMFSLEYFNTSSSKCILDVFKKLEAIHKGKNEVIINWYYEEDDEDMLEAGEDYESIIRVPFKMIEIVE